MAEVVYKGVGESAGVQGKLFKGIKFWLSQKVPQRSRFVDDVRANGGEVFPLEKQADVKIVDHARKEAPGGTHSYTFIERSMRNGILEDLEDHIVGPPEGTIRSVGSITQPPKGTRNKYTQEDDRIVWDWVNTNPHNGGGTDGNEIYKQLEAKYPQHPWQSWRDRYKKFLKGKPRPYAVPHNAPPTPPSDFNTANEEQHDGQHDNARKRQAFSEQDAQMLLDLGQRIQEFDSDRKAEEWKSLVNSTGLNSEYSPKKWQAFWDESIRPRHLRRKARAAQEALNQEGFRSRPQETSDQEASKSKPVSANITPSKRMMKSKLPTRSPSYRFESPRQLTEQQQQRHITGGGHAASVEISGNSENPKGMISSDFQGRRPLKRKLTEFEEELPSSSPPQAAWSPKYIRHSGEPLREIPSTPDRSPQRRARGQISPLFIENDEDIKSEDDREGDMDMLPLYSLNDDNRLSKRMAAETLPELMRTRENTQALWREPTAFIDFDVPPPDEGWGSQIYHEEQTPMFGSDGVSSATGTYEPLFAVPDTQNILQSKTQVPDFDLPAPDVGWESPMPSSPPQSTHSQQRAESVASSTDIGAQLDAWIDSFVEKGFLSETVEAALKCTSLDSKLAEELLEFLRRGKRKSSSGDPNEFPDDWRGVWTAADDENLYSTDARKIQRLEGKHGKESLKARWEFLDFYEGG